MTHRSRILKALAGLPVRKGKPCGLPRTVLEGLARTKPDRHAAPFLVDYLIAHGDIVMIGERRGAVYGLPKGAK